MNIVYVVIRVDQNNDKVVWKVYDSEEKAKEMCEALSDENYRYRYEDWLVK